MWPGPVLIAAVNVAIILTRKMDNYYLVNIEYFIRNNI